MLCCFLRLTPSDFIWLKEKGNNISGSPQAVTHSSIIILKNGTGILVGAKKQVVQALEVDER